MCYPAAMADKTSFTLKDLITALKQAGFPTKKDVEDIVHNQLTEFHAEITKPELDKLGKRIDQVDKKIDGLSVELNHVKDIVNGLKADLSLVPTKEEFNGLKTRVRRLEIARGDL